MGFGTMVQDLLGSLSGYLDSNGVVIPGREDMVNEVVKQIKGETNIDISVVSVENPETHEMESKIQVAEYTDPEGVVVPTTVYNSPNEMYEGVTAAGEGSTLNDYFGSSDIYIGVLSTTGGAKLAKALTLASGEKLNYAEVNGTYRAIGSQFIIEIIESTNNSPPVIKCWIQSAIPEKWIYVFDLSYAQSENCNAIKYIIRKGTSDCYLKGFYAGNTDEPTEEDFADVEMNGFNRVTTSEGVTTIQMRGDAHRGQSGFAIVGIESKVDLSGALSVVPGVSRYSSSIDSYAVVLWRDNGTPIFVTGGMDDWTESYAAQEWNRVITDAEDQVVALAPIFGPSSKFFGSKNSFWAMIVAQEGAYELSLGTLGNYYYDHGFALRLY